MLDLLNQRYGKLTVIEFIRKEGRYVYWKCKCDCGNEKIVKTTDLRRGWTFEKSITTPVQKRNKGEDV